MAIQGAQAFINFDKRGKNDSITRQGKWYRFRGDYGGRSSVFNRQS
jgi:hypothetical protein